ncbi:hypothetical protein [Curtobacterium sp. 20TX0008]|uniref:hypothetical protein n=1 Tax=Curtobacterium sp. 20TX0008 TaxID=3022018 RepID=UPI00232FF257|nr:hypothetical protein [Curtobacterium sp. 20TX0008]MDB6425928.1 hypothetical protein [Curtobacterium sp. 20TX0008]
MRQPRPSSKKRAVVLVQHDPLAPRPVQAAQIAFKVMAVAKVDTWAAALEHSSLAGVVELTDEQQRILEQERAVLPYLVRRGAIITVHACSVCGRYVFADSKSAPGARCTLRLGCSGAPVKASTTGFRPQTMPLEPTPGA